MCCPDMHSILTRCPVQNKWAQSDNYDVCFVCADTPETRPLIDSVNHWFILNHRKLPWRDPTCSAWGILLSEVMSQQTPVNRVEPMWLQWIKRWPTPTAFSHATKDDVLRAWDRLGYPRRALNLHAAATAMVEKYAGTVPDTEQDLASLPGIGAYTSRAVACFAYGWATPIVDTNIRRVIARSIKGQFLVDKPRAQDTQDMRDLLPASDVRGPRTVPEIIQALADTPHQVTELSNIEASILAGASLMELGALICTAKTARCDNCPLLPHCAWVRAGKPQPSQEQLAAAKARVQKFEGTDRQVRGRIMAILRKNNYVGIEAFHSVSPDIQQRDRALHSLLADGLVVYQDECYTLPR